MTQHTVRAYDEELALLSSKINQMGGIAEAMLVDAIDALVRNDVPKARLVVDRDVQIDLLQQDIEEMAVSLIARRQPMAIDLRRIMGSIRIATDIERIGDLVKNIGKRTSSAEDRFTGNRSLAGIQHMAHLVLQQIKTVLDAFAQNKPDLARHVWLHDGDIDQLNNSLFRELLTYMMEDPRSITFSTHLLFIAKNIERAGDHATNIAETVYFIETGQQLSGPRPKGDASALAFTPSME
ncbi:MAG: phosphate signaling complex protein PhoU [Hyphomicrobiales bacterium]|uniref:phosphate signaling complex protein PhoU n=1 Tax=Rhabdaerophilum calidifontis TaxID=2604328 RepID=UPI00123A3676|nr:phosphate signaling complex protein PhoU [Rhabdaerophilum calidifontis]MCA1951577.1 phosphate signaling complex protein PhoU [Hyphomicrobiales bacterium]MCA1999702.1 phosphate signaling complex protein PhoU [Hyphomicrobiales bacterium]